KRKWVRHPLPRSRFTAGKDISCLGLYQSKKVMARSRSRRGSVVLLAGRMIDLLRPGSLRSVAVVTVPNDGFRRHGLDRRTPVTSFRRTDRALFRSGCALEKLAQIAPPRRIC